MKLRFAIRLSLGVQIDDKLNWQEHINEISAKISRAVGLYCCSVWSCCMLLKFSICRGFNAGQLELHQVHRKDFLID